MFQLNFAFAVPSGGADEVVPISSTISWERFQHLIADAMDVSPKGVNVAYRFSMEPRTAHFSHLKKAEHLTALFQLAARAANLTKSKKPFSVVLKDLNEDGTKKKGVLPKSKANVCVFSCLVSNNIRKSLIPSFCTTDQRNSKKLHHCV